MVIKDSFFTVELSNEIPDRYTSQKYITFRFNKKYNKVVLYKYGENIIESNQKNDILCTEKSSGRFYFETLILMTSELNATKI